MVSTAGRLVAIGLIAASSAIAAPGPEPLGSIPTETGTMFRVWAPAARSVSVIGSFNNWKPGRDDALAPNPDDGTWAGHLRGAKPGDPYLYLLDGESRRRDPCARMVDPASTVSIIYDPAAFDWEGDKAPGILPEGMIIYEMHVGSFSDPDPKDGKPGTFYDAVRKLDYLVQAGFNTVCVMPIHDFIGTHSWGYNPIDLFAVENIYGGPDAFKTFVKACHQKGLAVHVDIVHNHYGPGTIDLEEFRDRDGGSLYFYDDHRGQTPWGPRPDFGKPGVRRFITDNVKMWIEEYRVDGFRWDSTINIREGGGALLPDGASLLDEINGMIRQEYPGVISIAEDSVDIGTFDGSWEYDFHHQVMPQLAALKEGTPDLYAVQDAVTRERIMHRVIYTDSHDEAGDLNGNVRIANDADPSNPASPHASRVIGLGALLTYTAPGIPMVLQGNEFQEDGPFSDMDPLDWTRVKKYAPLVRLHRDLARLRRNLDGRSRALLGRKAEAALVDQERGLLVYWRWHQADPSDRLVIAVNFSSTDLRGAAVPFPLSGTWSPVLNTDWKSYGGMTIENPRDRTRVSTPRGSAPVDIPAMAAVVFYRSAELPAAAKRPGEYQSLFISGSFNSFNPEDAPMKRLSPTLWMYRKPFYFSDKVTFTLTDGETSLGIPDMLPQALPLSVQLEPGANPVILEGTLTGDYVFAFHMDTHELAVYPYEPPPPGTKTFPLRDWKDQLGNRMKARFTGIKGRNVRLELDNGRVMQLPLADLDRRDQEYLAIITAP